jgi:hypothetical protein
MKKVLSILLGILMVFALVLLVDYGKKVEANGGPKNKTSICKTIQSGELLTSDNRVITTGFDEWGYNYQAMLFNGKYCNAYQDDDWCQPYKDVDILMKWNDAWLSNKDCDGDGLLDRHYGFGSYIGSGAWLTNHMRGEYEDTSSYHWDISGEWIIAVNSGTYLHDYTFSMTSLEDGTFTGFGGYPSGASPYIYDEIVIDGMINGNSISFKAIYYQGGNPTGYSWTTTGTIDSSGEMSGTGTSGVNEWHSTSGSAEKSYSICEWSYFVKIVAVPGDATKDAGYWYSAENVKIGPVIWGDFAIVQEVDNDPCAGYEGVSYKGAYSPGFGFYKPR